MSTDAFLVKLCVFILKMIKRPSNLLEPVLCKATFKMIEPILLS